MKSLSRVRPSATPWTAAYQAPLSMGFSRQEYWSGVPLPSPSPFTRAGKCPWPSTLPWGCFYYKIYPQLLQFFEIPIGVSLTWKHAFKAISFSTLSPPPRPLFPHQMLSPLLSLFKAVCDQPLPPEHAPPPHPTPSPSSSPDIEWVHFRPWFWQIHCLLLLLLSHFSYVRLCATP